MNFSNAGMEAIYLYKNNGDIFRAGSRINLATELKGKSELDIFKDLSKTKCKKIKVIFMAYWL